MTEGSRDSWRAQKNLCAPGPPVIPRRDWAKPAHECWGSPVEVQPAGSCSGDRGAGSHSLGRRVCWHKSSWGGLHQPYQGACRLKGWAASGWTADREGAQPQPSADNSIQVLQSMALPTRARPTFPQGQSLPSGSLLSSSTRGQTEEARTVIPQPPGQKPQAEKANQNHHMDHSLV